MRASRAKALVIDPNFFGEEQIMSEARIEHANITVTDPEATAVLLGRLFGWKIRWQGPTAMGGWTVHVGNDFDYLSLYTPGSADDQGQAPQARGVLNHIGVHVDDLDAAETRVRAAGLEPYSHSDYEPGRRFYFRDADGIEFEVVSYA